MKQHKNETFELEIEKIPAVKKFSAKNYAKRFQPISWQYKIRFIRELLEKNLTEFKYTDGTIMLARAKSVADLVCIKNESTESVMKLKVNSILKLVK